MLDETGIKIISISLVGLLRTFVDSSSSPHWSPLDRHNNKGFLLLTPSPTTLWSPTLPDTSLVKGYIFTVMIIWHAFIHHQKSFWSEWIRYRQLYLLLHTPWCWCWCNGSSIEYWSLQQHVLVQLPAHLNPAHSKYLHNNLLQSKSGDHHSQEYEISMLIVDWVLYLAFKGWHFWSLLISTYFQDLIFHVIFAHLP